MVILLYDCNNIPYKSTKVIDYCTYGNHHCHLVHIYLDKDPAA